MVLCKEASLTVSIGRSKFPPWGVDGGCNGTPNYCIIYKHDEKPKKVRKVAALRLVKGEMVSLRDTGGEGWGSPLDRDPKLVQWDVKNKYITIETARNIYGVVLDPKTLEIDTEETKRIREEILNISMDLFSRNIASKGTAYVDLVTENLSGNH